jgi:hypothetical protein
MSAWLMNAKDWAEQEFGEVQSGDVRRTERLVEVAAAMTLKPGESLPKAMGGVAELKAAYRLFGREELTHPTLLEGHCGRTRAGCQQPGRYLLIGDTTEIDYTSHKATEGLGCIGEKNSQRGFLLHSTLAVAISAAQVTSSEDGPQVRHERELMGVFDQKLWRRPDPAPLSKRAKKKDGWRGNTNRPRESDRWIEALEKMIPPSQVQYIYVADREGDIYECLQGTLQNRLDVVIRAARARKLQQQQDKTLFEAVAQAPVLGSTKLRLRAKAGRKARTATLELRVCTIELRGPERPGGRLEPLTITVVEAREKRAAKANAKNVGDTDSDEKLLHWVLLTSLPAGTLLEALEVVAIYRERWLIEDYHKALKSGTGVERFQLGSADALESVIAIVAVLAARLLGLQLLASKAPQTPLPAHSSDPQLLAILEARFGLPKNGWNVAEYLRAIARLGGFLGRKCDGSPGWMTLWRGVRELSTILTTLDLLTAQKKCGQ